MASKVSSDHLGLIDPYPIALAAPQLCLQAPQLEWIDGQVLVTADGGVLDILIHLIAFMSAMLQPRPVTCRRGLRLQIQPQLVGLRLAFRGMAGWTFRSRRCR